MTRKQIVNLTSALVLAIFPLNAVAVDLPLSKKLVAEIPAPWGQNVPKLEDFQVFECGQPGNSPGQRIYAVWQEQKENGYKGQKISKLFAFKNDGKKLTKFWQIMAEDSANSQVRFSGTCVGERAVIVNHWEDPLHKTAGDMATSVNGEETYGPLWKPDGRTIYHWYKSDGADYPSIVLNDGSKLSPPNARELVITRAETSISGAIWRSGNSVFGSSVNFALAPDGRAYAAGAPFYKDVKSGDLATLAVYKLNFRRRGGAWLVGESQIAKNGVNTIGSYLRGEAESAWRVVQSKELCALDSGDSRQGALQVTRDGLYFARFQNCSESGAANYAPAVRIHRAESADAVLSPHIYTAPALYGVGNSFAYGVRTGDGKIQVWEAGVK